MLTGYVAARDLRPGNAVRNSQWLAGVDEREVLDVVAVSGPDAEGLVLVSCRTGPPVRFAEDWPMEVFTESSSEVRP